MPELSNPFNTLQSFRFGAGRTGRFYSLPELERQGIGPISRLPVSIRVVLESVLRHCDGQQAREADVRALANWQPHAERTAEIPFVVARILLQDFTGVPLLVDLAAMRSAVARVDRDPSLIEPLVPVDLVIDHSVQVDYSEIPNALQLNMEMEFKRNRARYQFLKWGTQAFHGFTVIPPGIGICHQVNLEYLAKGVLRNEGSGVRGQGFARGEGSGARGQGESKPPALTPDPSPLTPGAQRLTPDPSPLPPIYYPDTLVGTDSHTTMINGLGIVGWGVGGIEAEAGMLGQPVYFLTPDVVGVHLTGALRPGVTATDLVLRITEMLRQAKVVGKFVEYHGEGAASLSVTDRATIGNMSPEYGATIGYFPVDEQSCRYFAATGRSEEQVDAIRGYFQAQGMFGMPRQGEIDYSTLLELDLASIVPSVSGPKRPQDRIDLPALKDRFHELLHKPLAENGYNKPESEDQKRYVIRTGVNGHNARVDLPLVGGGEQDPATVPEAVIDDVSVKNTSTDTEVEMMQNRPTPDRVEEVPPGEYPRAVVDLGHGDVVIAAITSCTNTSNPSVMLAAGLLAKKAVEKGLSVRPAVKTSLAPGSRVVSDYLQKTGLQPYLDELGFQVVGYGCTSCIGNSGPLEPHLEETVTTHDLVVASVLSGNRNFEARVHQSVKANFLMSPPLVVAFALAGRVDIDMSAEPLGKDKEGQDVYLRDIWPSTEEIGGLLQAATDPETYRRLYRGFTEQNPLWAEVPSSTGKIYDWDPDSTYIQEPPYFDKFSMQSEPVREIRGARPLAIFGDSVTTDHISPAGAIQPSSPAGLYLQERGIAVEDFNSYGSRRGNDRVMTRGTFANVRIKNLMVPGVEGGITLHQPHGERMSIYDAAIKYQAAHVPLVIIAGQEYGTGSSRDWAAKGAQLLGVRAVIAQSFERIHRSNLVGMGVLPCQFKPGDSAPSLHLDGTETFDLLGLESGLAPRQELALVIHRANGDTQEVPVILRIDTPVEVEYYQHGGILPYVLRQLLREETPA